jgi:hypothetical protein
MSGNNGVSLWKHPVVPCVAVISISNNGGTLTHTQSITISVSSLDVGWRHDSHYNDIEHNDNQNNVKNMALTIDETQHNNV